MNDGYIRLAGVICARTYEEFNYWYFGGRRKPTYMWRQINGEVKIKNKK